MLIGWTEFVRTGTLLLVILITAVALVAASGHVPLWLAVAAGLGAFALFVVLHAGLDRVEKWHKRGPRRRFEAWRRSLDK